MDKPKQTKYSAAGVDIDKGNAFIEEIRDIVKATLLGTFAIYILSLLFNMEMITPVFLISFWSGSKRDDNFCSANACPPSRAAPFGPSSWPRAGEAGVVGRTKGFGCQ